MVGRIVLILFVIISMPVVVWVSVQLWQGADFFYGELINRKMMALGDTRSTTFVERMVLRRVWLPFWLFVGSATTFYLAIILRAVRKKMRNDR